MSKWTNEEIERCIIEGNSYGYTNGIAALYDYCPNVEIGMKFVARISTRDGRFKVKSDICSCHDEATINAYRKIRLLEEV